MPSSAKLVIGGFLLLLILNAIYLFARMDFSPGVAARHIVPLVIQTALLIGLCTQQVSAWYFARWLSGIAAFVCVLGLVTAFFATNAALAIFLRFGVALFWSSALFYLLGRSDTKAYFKSSGNV